ncbi:hypothetical protein Emag_007689 [Eimeria magna]
MGRATCVPGSRRCESSKKSLRFVSNALMGAENREAAAPQGVQPAGTGGVQNRFDPLAGQRENQFLASDQEERAETGNGVGVHR